MDKIEGNVHVPTMTTCQPWVVVGLLQSSSSQIFKRNTLKYESLANNDAFFKGLQWAFSGFTRFGVKDVEEAYADGPGLHWDDFEALLHKLDTRQLTGNAAKAAIDEAMDASLADQWNLWYRLILQKEFRAGFTGKTVNELIKIGDVQAKYRIDLFTSQLALDGLKAGFSSMKGKKILDKKLDGIRMLIVAYASGQVQLYSREGAYLTDKFPTIVKAFEGLNYERSGDYVFDTEVISVNFKETMRMANKKSHPDFIDATAYVFDVIPLPDFLEGECQITQTKRKHLLNEMLAGSLDPSIDLLSYIEVDLDTKEGYAEFLKYNRAALDAGFEGIMVKDADAPYICKRSANWLKIKPFIEVTMTVLGM